MNNEALNEYISNALTTVLPMEVASRTLRAEAESVEITDSDSLKGATTLRTKINGHIKEVASARMALTRQLDDVKRQFIDGERKVTTDAVAAKDIVSDKLLAWAEKMEAELRAEQEHVDGIIEHLRVGSFKTLRDVDAAGASLKSAYAQLSADDQRNPQIKLAFVENVAKLSTMRETISSVAVDAETKRQADEIAAAERASAIKAAEAQAKREIAQKPKTGIKTVIRFTIVNADLVPIEYCTPSDQLIRAAVNSGVRSIPGVDITEEKSF